MASIHSKNTKPEILLRRGLFSQGLRYRIHYALPGKPDIVFLTSRVVVFVDGDFWHGYNWLRKGIVPKESKWQIKIKKNVARDKIQTKVLEDDGWIVIRFWEHEVLKSLEKCIETIKDKLGLET